MNFSAIIHQPKSEYSYAYNEDTLHLRLKTAREDVTAVEVLAVDPFNWVPRNGGSGIYDFDKQSVVRTFMKKEQETLEHDCWFVEITGIPSKRTKYCFVVENAEEKYIIGCHGKVPYTLDESVLYNLFNYFNYPFINEEDLYEAPNWVGNTVWYQIFPERFCNGTPNDDRDVLPWGSDELDGAEKKFGGNLAGIIQKLDYIKSLGVTGIYFTPMFASPSSHKYDTSDYFTIDKEFGNNETLGQLVEEAHKRGIKVMLDAVFNHCGFYHPFWQDVLKNGTKSKYIDYFHILDKEKPIFDGEIKDGVPQEIPRQRLNYRTFAYNPAMPKWNTNHPEVRKYLIQVGCYWIEKYHIDGWRLDVSNEVSHSFWREFRQKVREVKKDIFILGENWDSAYPWLMGEQFDSVMNYALATPIWNYFKVSKNNEGYPYNLETFRHQIGHVLTSYPRNVTEHLFNLLESHDTERMLHRVADDVDIVKLAYIFLFTFAGTPCIYYGGEIGMGGGEHSNRQCMIWDEEKQNKNLRSFLQTLIKLRGQYECFRTIDIEWIVSKEEHSSELLAYKKISKNETLYVFLNKNKTQISYPLPDELQNRQCMEVMTGAKVWLNHTILIEEKGYRMYLVKNEQ